MDKRQTVLSFRSRAKITSNFSKATGTELQNRAIADGMLTLRQDGWRRVLSGQTTVEEVLRVTQNDEVLAEED